MCSRLSVFNSRICSKGRSGLTSRRCMSRSCARRRFAPWSLADFKHYIVVTVLCKPWLNGAVPLARSVLADFGLTSSDTTNRSIQNLIARGLIVRTRAARPRHAALYGVCHMPLNGDAMKKAGARDPRETLSDTRTENSVRSPDRIPPISASNSVRPPDTSKNLPCGMAEKNGLPGHVVALLDRVYAHGGTVTAADDLRVRWWRGEPPADLAGEMRLHAKGAVHRARLAIGARKRVRMRCRKESRVLVHARRTRWCYRASGEVRRLLREGLRFIQNGAVMSSFHAELAQMIFQQVTEYNKELGFGNPDDFVFFPHLKNREFALQTVRRHFDHCLTIANLEHSAGVPRTLYSLRHTAAMLTLTLGDSIDLLTLARNMRSSVSMLERFYVRHLSAEMNVEKLQSRKKRIQ
jgi:hypothetical protein